MSESEELETHLTLSDSNDDYGTVKVNTSTTEEDIKDDDIAKRNDENQKIRKKPAPLESQLSENSILAHGNVNQLLEQGRAGGWLIKRTDFEFMESEPFAYGAGGELYKVKYRGLPCVAKSTSRMIFNSMQVNDLSNEIKTMATLRHPNLVLFLGANIEPKKDELKSPLLFMEMVEGGTLERRLLDVSQNRRRCIFKERIQYSIEIARAINFLHTNDPVLIHRDLKPSNIMLTKHTRRVKVADFGLAKFMPRFANETMTSLKSMATLPIIEKDKLRDKETKEELKKALPHANQSSETELDLTAETGSYRYMAPEVFQHEVYGVKVDIYSLAFVFFFIHAGIRPFPHIREPIDVVMRCALKNDRPPLNAIREPAIRQLLQTMWNKTPQERPTAIQVLESLEKIESDFRKKSYAFRLQSDIRDRF